VYLEAKKKQYTTNKQTIHTMSIEIKYGISPEEIHWFGDIAPEIWDLIYTWAEYLSNKDIVDKYMSIPRKYTCWNGGCVSREKYCKENKITKSYNGQPADQKYSIMGLRIMFDLFGRTMPKCSKLPVKYKKKGITREMVRDCWEQEDQNIYIIAVEKMIINQDIEYEKEEWKKEGITYTGDDQFLYMIGNKYQQEKRK